MKNLTLQSIITVIVSMVIAMLIAQASQGFGPNLGVIDERLVSVSLFHLLAVIAFLVNWIIFIPSYTLQTEHYYDLTGSLTYLTLLIVAVIFGNAFSDPRALLVAILAGVWTIRLGTFLFLRVKKSGSDSRFDDIKPSLSRFFAAWTLQGLWAFVTLTAALTVIASTKRVPLDLFAAIGTLIWLFGFSVEVIADNQKSAFKKNPENEGRFISSGLWAYSRHPNYFGEITLWTGMFIIAIPVLQGWQWVALISPIFVYLLLTRVSGVPLLEDIADERWGGQSDYETYKATTSELVLLPKKTIK